MGNEELLREFIQWLYDHEVNVEALIFDADYSEDIILRFLDDTVREV